MYISIATIKNHIYGCKYQNYSLLNNSMHNYSVKTHQTLSHIFINFAPQNPALSIFNVTIIDSCVLRSLIPKLLLSVIFPHPLGKFSKCFCKDWRDNRSL